jgi:3-deoxy-D-manno-octulosonate 8-phosphate phosphatase (KDO 8-P phosphatase)
MSTAQERANKIQLMGFDVDGTLTDGGLYFGPTGEVFKRFSVFDGHGLRSLIESGIQVAWITARQSDIVTQRAADLKIPHLIQASKDKLSVMDALKNSLGLDWAACGFFGDDWPDFPVLQQVGFAATTQTAPLRMRAQAHWVATRAAGHGAAREVCDFICEHHPQGIRHG